MTKRIFIACLVLIISAGAAVATGEQESAAAVDGGFNETGYPIVDEPITLDMMGIQRFDVTKPYNEMALIREVTELTNINVNWDLTVAADWETRLNLAFASGDYPDAIYGSQGRVDVQRYGIGDRVVVPLTELIDRYATNLNRVFAEDSSYRAAMLYADGNIYAMPHATIDRSRTMHQQAFIRQGWLDRVGLEIPSTIDEFTDVLRAFRDQDADGDGDPNNEIPFSFLYGHSVMGELALYGAFGVQMAQNMGWTAYNDDQVVFAPTLEAFGEAVDYMHGLYAEGLLDPESFTQDRSVFFAKMKSRSIGFYCDWFPERFDEAAPGLVAIEQFAVPGRDPSWPTMPLTPQRNQGLLITSENEHPEATVRWGDWWYEEENTVRAAKGYDLVEFAADGSIGLKSDEETPEGLTFEEWRHLDSPGVNALFFITASLQDRLGRDGPLQRKYDSQEMLYRDIAMPPWPDPAPTAAEAEIIDLYESDILDFVDTRVAEWIVNGTMDDNFDTFMNEVRRLGLDEWLDARNAQYQRYLESK